LGVTVLAWPDVTAYAVVVIIGIWALATGLAEFIGAISLRRVISGEFWFILAGILSIILGVLLVAMPKAGAATLLLFIAIYAVVFGVMLTFLSFRLRKLQPGD
ncbi:MAG: DUF308 domain-containing protein, partial [Chloroflexi bacterium]|nr:DUF308 domain-containing protein [Chloroflexota bacterium]